MVPACGVWAVWFELCCQPGVAAVASRHPVVTPVTWQRYQTCRVGALEAQRCAMYRHTETAGPPLTDHVGEEAGICDGDCMIDALISSSHSGEGAWERQSVLHHHQQQSCTCSFVDNNLLPSLSTNHISIAGTSWPSVIALNHEQRHAVPTSSHPPGQDVWQPGTCDGAC